MASDKAIEIYIDNFVGDGGEEFVIFLKNKLSRLKIDASYNISSFSELHKGDDLDNESNTIKAIQAANIVIPIVTSDFIQYVTSDIEAAYNEVINSKDTYFFPFLLKTADWSDHDWLVRTKLTPQDANPYSELSQHYQEETINKFVKLISSSIVKLSKQNIAPLFELISSKSPQKGIVFISHDHDDADFAELLKLKLEKEGIGCWLDTERLKIGQDWREEIDQGIIDSAAVIAIMTPEARKSEYVTYEWAFAWGKGKKIFPLMLKQTQLHPRLESLQYLNFTDNPTRPWEHLIASI